MTTVSIKYISKIRKEFENLPYEGYMRKRPKYIYLLIVTFILQKVLLIV